MPSYVTMVIGSLDLPHSVFNSLDTVSLPQFVQIEAPVIVLIVFVSHSVHIDMLEFL